METLILIDENGNEETFDIGDKVQRLIHHIERHNIERIVVGEITDGTPEWEKQFEPVTVMPPSFGAKQ